MTQQALARLLQDMGMASALSKRDTSDYHETVARQLGDLLLPRMARMGGVVTLTDVYCLINRARSTHLLSPDDLLRAASLLPKLNVGLKTRTFRSGLVVLQDARIDDVQVAELLRDACAAGITALEAAALLKTTPLLAQEQLWAAEQMGYLARDEQVETVRFFPNRFDEWMKSAGTVGGG
jgi:ESCRT-II complex subunit VPS36